MVLAGLLGGVLTLGLLRSADAARPVLVAARDLAPGTLIDDGALRVAHVDATDEIAATLFDAGAVDQLRGQVVTAPVARGALVTRDDVRPAADGAATRAMSFPIPRANAVDGRIDAGDRIDVVGVDPDTGDAGYVMTDAAVLAVDDGGGGPLGGDDTVTVTVGLDPDAALRLAGALAAGTVSIVRATGAAALREAPAIAHATAGGGDG
jgi:Flp pilus assembly protein CpaB